MQGAYFAMALLGGAVIALQAVINSRLSQFVGHPVNALLTSFVVGSLGAAIYALVTRPEWATWSVMKSSPWWIWCGGLLGLVYVLVAILAAPRLGVGLMLALVVASQMLTAMAIDHWGLLGAPVQPITALRFVGVALVIGGAATLALQPPAIPGAPATAASAVAGDSGGGVSGG